MMNVRCPVCDRLLEGADRSECPQFPFCSDRCKLIDLGRWLGERYGIWQDKQAEDHSPSNDEYSIP